MKQGKKYLLFLVLVLLSTANTFSQIPIQNPSFEGPPGPGQVPSPWIICCGTPDTDPCSYQPNTLNFPAANGSTYIGEYFYPDNNGHWREITSQKLSCNMAKGRLHSLTVDLAYLNTDPDGNNISPGILRIYGGFGICDTAQILWQSPTLDNTWHTYNVSFIPDTNYTYIILYPYCDTLNNSTYVVVDNFSPYITVSNAGRVKGMADSAFIHSGSCVSLSAQVTGTEYTNVSWSSIPVGFSDSILNAGTVCPVQNTQYIVTIVDTCGLTSSDTVSVNIIGNSVNAINVPTVIIVNTPSQWQIQNLPAKTGVSIYDVLGQLVYSSNNYQNDFMPYQLPSATYFYQLRFSNGRVRNGKMIVIR